MVSVTNDENAPLLNAANMTLNINGGLWVLWLKKHKSYLFSAIIFILIVALIIQATTTGHCVNPKPGPNPPKPGPNPPNPGPIPPSKSK